MRRRCVERDRGACVECTACAARCRAGALAIARPSYTVRLDPARCTGCGRCVDACGYRALAVAARALSTAGAA